MIKTITNLTLHLQKHSFLKLTNRQLFSKQKPSQSNFDITYPYRFGGGSMQGQFQHNKKTKFFFQVVFQKSLFDGFKQAYRSIVHSLAQNDVQTLKSTFEPNILNHFKERQVQLLNPDADIEIACGRGLVLLEGTFLRTGTSQFLYAFDEQTVKRIRYFKPQFDPQYLLLDFYVRADSNTSVYSLMTKDISVLFSFQMFFKSNMKLIPKDHSPEDYLNTQEIHSVQFQVQNKFNFLQLIKKGLFKKTPENPNRQNIALQVFGENYEWKVGDVDRSLGGNLVLIQ